MRAKLAIALGIVYVVWGSTYFAIAVADRTLPPLLMLAVRFALAGGLLYAWSAWRGDIATARPGRREWTAAAIVGGLLLFVDTGGVAWAEQRVASGFTALLIAAVPLFTAVLDRTFFGVRLSLGALGGIATGLLGVALLVGQSAHLDPVGAAVILGAAFAWAAGSAYARVAPLPKAPFLSAAMQMLCAAALLAIAGQRWGRSAGCIPPRSRWARWSRSRSSSFSARSSPSRPTAGFCGAARQACSSRHTPTSIPESRYCSAGSSPARPSVVVSWRPAR